MTRLAVFDCDGTLIDGQASICDAMERAFDDAGLPRPRRSEVRRMVGLSLPQAMHRLAPEASPEAHDRLIESYKHAFRSARQSGSLSQALFPGIRDVVERLAQAGWLLGVATGMSRRGLDHCLAEHGLADRFVTLQTADDHPSKPHSAMLEAALGEAGALPAEAVMIGDTGYDMLMAQDAGVRAIGVDWGYHTPRELREAGAEWVASSPAELADYLLR